MTATVLAPAALPWGPMESLGFHGVPLAHVAAAEGLGGSEAPPLVLPPPLPLPVPQVACLTATLDAAPVCTAAPLPPGGGWRCIHGSLVPPPAMPELSSFDEAGHTLLIQWPTVVHATAYQLELCQEDGTVERYTIVAADGSGPEMALAELRIGGLQPGACCACVRCVAPCGCQSAPSPWGVTTSGSAWSTLAQQPPVAPPLPQHPPEAPVSVLLSTNPVGGAAAPPPPPADAAPAVEAETAEGVLRAPLRRLPLSAPPAHAPSTPLAERETPAAPREPPEPALESPSARTSQAEAFGAPLQAPAAAPFERESADAVVLD